MESTVPVTLDLVVPSYAISRRAGRMAPSSGRLHNRGSIDRWGMEATQSPIRHCLEHPHMTSHRIAPTPAFRTISVQAWSWLGSASQFLTGSNRHMRLEGEHASAMGLVWVRDFGEDVLRKS